MFFFTIFFFFLIHNAFAEWSLVSIHKNKTTEFYVNKNEVRKNGSTRYFWILWNLTDYNADRDYNSAIVYVELDCISLRGKDLEFITKSLLMGEGKIVDKYNPPGEWKYPPPNSNMEAVYKTVCKL